MLEIMLLFWTCMLLKLCGLLGLFDVYFENVRFAHRALIRPFPTSSSSSSNSSSSSSSIVSVLVLVLVC